MSRAAWLAGIAAVLPIAAVAAPSPSTPAMAAGFHPPATPLVLTRTLRHVLHDGNAVVTRRSYRVQFVAERDGFRIDGVLTNVSVEAPAGLEALAALERQRPDTDMFPMKLDSDGRLLPAPEPLPGGAQHQGIALASARIAGMGLPAGEAASAQSFVAQLNTYPYRTLWPLDLFHPAAGERRDQRAIALTDGAQGQVTTEIDAGTDPASGLLRTFNRTVTTDFGGDTRVVIERWTLAPAP